MIQNKTSFLHFNPSDGFQLYADGLLSGLMDIAPSDASAHSSIEKAGARYFCKIEIKSALYRFDAVNGALTPQKALDEARRKIIMQVSKWRKKRFATR